MVFIHFMMTNIIVIKIFKVYVNIKYMVAPDLV